MPEFDYLTGEGWWMLHLFLVVLAVVTFNHVAGIVMRQLHRKAERVRSPWAAALLDAAQKPFNLLIWLLGIAYAADIVHAQSGAEIFTLVAPIRKIGVVVIATWFLVRTVTNAERHYARRAADSGEFDRTTVTALGNLGKISIIITGALIAIQAMGYSISGVLAFGGIGGIAIGFAAKDMLANLFGSLIIFLDRPFKIGDWIRSADREIEGTVESIGWRMTVIRTFDQRPLYVPNAVFSTITIENPSRMTNRRIHETIGIRYADFDAMEHITREVREMLIQHPAIDATRTLMVNFNAFGASSLDFFVYTFTKTTAWAEFHDVKQEILLRIGRIIEAHGAEIAFPTRTLHIAPEPASGG